MSVGVRDTIWAQRRNYVRHIWRTGGEETSGDCSIVIIIVAVQPSEVYNIEGSYALRDRLSL